ncbi:two-component system response regulator YesN [Paenibacillus sp. V4I3]|uniref:response regulator transcription factor n=1 Tax=unclassified Paenibacillus TaxID=185978 RepID=UPI002783DD8D|nr:MULTISPECIES: response regulator [unclassified Paenibacillus]MDQ0873907.1 two-component system response regulator YesN [Paenibacillus sp. V4I3]MDQ0890216.1 two-component system response regulator YesN [Paenibacillus sp. V4I9]
MTASIYRAVIIDDEAWIREGLSMHINWELIGIELVRVFQDGLEAIDYIQNHPVDIILSDIRMPNMTGLELVARLRELENENHLLSNIKVIFLSGYGDFKYAQEALRLGAVNYLLKPTEVEDIEDALQKAKQMCAKEAMQTNKQPVEPIVFEEPSSYLIKKALHIMNARFTEDIQLNLIAEELFVTSNYLSRLFRQETGKSFSDYLSYLRIEKACELLAGSTLKIYQIGEAVGYPNPRYFSEWFQKQMGMSPGDYRSRLS